MFLVQNGYTFKVQNGYASAYGNPASKKAAGKAIVFRHVDRKLPLIRDACERKMVVAAAYVKRVIVSSKTVTKMFQNSYKTFQFSYISF